jgi:hypothetical protein
MLGRHRFRRHTRCPINTLTYGAVVPLEFLAFATLSNAMVSLGRENRSRGQTNRLWVPTAALVVLALASSAYSAPLPYVGVNLAGADFGTCLRIRSARCQLLFLSFSRSGIGNWGIQTQNCWQIQFWSFSYLSLKVLAAALLGTVSRFLRRRSIRGCESDQN